MNASFIHNRDERPQRFGWAPGGYIRKCPLCDTQFVGDKRAYMCAPCAYAKPDEATTPNPSPALSRHGGDDGGTDTPRTYETHYDLAGGPHWVTRRVGDGQYFAYHYIRDAADKLTAMLNELADVRAELERAQERR